MELGEFPTQDICDPKKPDEFAAWALVALPRMNGAALPMSSEYIQEVSKRLWEAGFRWHRKHQKVKWRAPSTNDPHWLTNPGRWVKVTDPDPEPEQQLSMIDLLRAMDAADKKAGAGEFDAALDLIRKERS